MKGSIAILLSSENILDEFKRVLDTYTQDPCAGWYASILEGNVVYFLWADSEYKPTDDYLRSLQKDGYQIPYQL
jgi:hypothetical protein